MRMATNTYCSVIPAKAGIYGFQNCWIPAFAGMTSWVSTFAGMIIGDWQRHMDLSHYNPVKHQHVAQIAPINHCGLHSTFHRYAKLRGDRTYPRD